MRSPSILDDLTAEWVARGWPVEDLHGFRMEAAGDDGSDDDGSADDAGDGGSDDDGSADDAGDDAGDADDDKALGPKGEKALAAEKDKRRTAQAELREWKALGLKPADLKKILDDRKGDDKSDPELIRSEAKAEAQAELMQSRVLDKIEAKAARLFADPDDAAALLMKDHDADDFLDDGKIDIEAIQDALKALLEKKPYLAAQGAKKFQGGADGGTRKDDRPAQLTRDDLKTMTPLQIEKAEQNGELDNLLQGKAT